MNRIAFATVDQQGAQRVAAVDGDQVYLLPPAVTMRGVLADWERCLEQHREAVASGMLRERLPLAGLRLLPPVPDPPNLFMAGAN